MLILALACSHPTHAHPNADGDADTDADSDADSDTDTDTADSADSGGTHDSGTTTADPRVGQVYVVEVGNGNWSQPAGIGSLFQTYWPDSELLVTPTSLAATDLELLAGPSIGGVQDLCQPTTTLSSAAFADPNVDGAGGPMSFGTVLAPLNVDSSRLVGRFDPTGVELDQITVGGELDTRPLGPLLGFGSDPGTMCELLAEFGVRCDACASGVGRYCTSLQIDVTKGPVRSASVVPRTTADIDADSACN